MPQNKAILFLLPDCPGYFTELFYRLAEVLKDSGYMPLFATTSPFYERMKKVNLAAVGKVYYLDEFLRQPITEERYKDFPINNWSNYASYSRQTYYFGGPLNNNETLKKAKLFFQTIYDNHNVVLQVCEGVSNTFIYLAHEQGTANGIPYFGLMGARIPYHFNVHLDVVGNEVLLNQEAPADYVPTDDVPDYMKNSQFGGLFDRKNSLFSFSFLKELLSFLFIKGYRSFETANSKWFIFRVYKIAFRRIVADFYFRKLAKIFERTIVFEKNKTYVVYPLHFFPEASTSIFAKYYDGNELNLVKNIAFSLPENCVLVVKEHKVNVGNNSRAFYNKLKQLPNVILLSPYYNLKDNIENFDAVVTLSSTVGFEALTKDVPVYTLGEIFYQSYPGCTKINSYAELEAALAHIGKRTTTNQKNKTFALYSKMCFPGSFNYMSRDCLNEQNLRFLLKPVFDFLRDGALPNHYNDIPITEGDTGNDKSRHIEKKVSKSIKVIN